MRASLPSKMALATSEASARVGRGFSCIESSICVAVITGTSASRACMMICFCATGTFSGFISTPRSPRATITQSATARISEIVDGLRFFKLDDDGNVLTGPADRRFGHANVRRGAHKTLRHVIHIEREGKSKVAPILGRERRNIKFHAWKIDPLVLAKLAAVFHLANYRFAACGKDAHGNVAVAHKNSVAFVNGMWLSSKGGDYSFVGTSDCFRGDRQFLAETHLDSNAER